MGNPQRFGNSELGTGKNDLPTKRKFNPVAGRNKDGFNTCARTQTESDHLILPIPVQTVGSLPVRRRLKGEKR